MTVQCHEFNLITPCCADQSNGPQVAPQVNRYGETEPGYLLHLRKTLYRHQAQTMGYGIKVWPEDYATIKSKAPEVDNLGGL